MSGDFNEGSSSGVLEFVDDWEGALDGLDGWGQFVFNEVEMGSGLVVSSGEQFGQGGFDFLDVLFDGG